MLFKTFCIVLNVFIAMYKISDYYFLTPSSLNKTFCNMSHNKAYKIGNT